jgi:hypothetical protein
LFRAMHSSYFGLLTSDSNRTGLRTDMRKGAWPQPRRNCSHQNRISFQLQSARVFRHANVHVASPYVTHGSKIADEFDINRQPWIMHA